MATTNNRVHSAYHGGATGTTAVINGEDAGGLMSANISAGYRDEVVAPQDGFAFPEVDALTQFCNGSIISQDWIEMINVLTGTVGTYVFYEKESGVDTVTIHTLTNPKIHRASLNLQHRGRGSCSWDFECMAADETKTVAEMWDISEGQTKPAAITTYTSALEILTAALGAQSIYHCMGLTLDIGLRLLTASSDGDVGLTAVDVVYGGIPIRGTLVTQSISEMQTILLASEADLVLSIKIPQGGSNKTLTLKNVKFTGVSTSPSSDGGYTNYNLSFYLNNDMTTQMGIEDDNPLTGDTAILTIT